MKLWRIFLTRQAEKDAKNLSRSNLKPKALSLLEVLAEDPYANPPPYEKLVGESPRTYSRRLNIQDRVVYEVLEAEHAIKILRLWTHYK